MNRNLWFLNIEYWLPRYVYHTKQFFNDNRYYELKVKSWDFLSHFQVFGYQIKYCVMFDKKYDWSLLATQTQAHKKERQKSINFNNQSKIFARSAQFLHISLLSLRDYDVKTSNFTLCGG